MISLLDLGWWSPASILEMACLNIVSKVFIDLLHWTFPFWHVIDSLIGGNVAILICSAQEDWGSLSFDITWVSSLRSIPGRPSCYRAIGGLELLVWLEAGADPEICSLRLGTTSSFGSCYQISMVLQGCSLLAKQRGWSLAHYKMRCSELIDVLLTLMMCNKFSFVTSTCSNLTLELQIYHYSCVWKLYLCWL